MNTLICFVIVILLTIVTIMLIIFLPRPKCFYSTSTVCPELLAIACEDNLLTIRNELQDKTAIVLYDQIYLSDDNKKIYLSNDVNRYTQTYNLLTTLPDVQRISIEVIKPKTETAIIKNNMPIETHSVMRNNNILTLRCILPIDISGTNKSGIWCDGETRFFKDGAWIVFNHSKEHSYFNKHKHLGTKLLTVDITFID